MHGPRCRFRRDPKNGSRGGSSICQAARAGPVPFDLVCLQVGDRGQDSSVLISVLRLSEMPYSEPHIIGGDRSLTSQGAPQPRALSPKPCKSESHSSFWGSTPRVGSSLGWVRQTFQSIRVRPRNKKQI